jgi:sigma-B regulation protein RsbU (phosphoserine phosphatase)
VQDHLNVVSTSLEQIASGGLGICEVCHDPVDDALLRMDYTACVCLGHYSDQELRALEKELELSQVIQRALLPRHPPAINGIDTAGFSRPASIVGGDYFDFVRFKDGSHGFIVADVSGHGVSAGMLMTSLQTAFQTLAPDTKSPVEVLQRLNRLYLHNINFTTFVTIFFGQYEPSSRLFTYANAGHNSGYLYRSADQHEEWLHATGPAIGLMEGYSVRTEEVQLHPGDHLVLYTDGVTEAVNQDDEPFGEDRLAEAVRKSAGRPAEAMVQAILSAITLFMGTRDFADDATLVVLKAS